MGEEAAEQSSVTPARSSIFSWPLVGMVWLYQVTLRPFMGGHCRFHPSCSNYAIDALKTHGPIKGLWLALRRIMRCHPWGGFGYDPVPRKPENER